MDNAFNFEHSTVLDANHQAAAIEVPAMLMEKIKRKFRAEGIGGLAQAVVRRLIPQRPLEEWAELEPMLKGRHGLEIGGPSVVFGRSGLAPVYAIASQVDNCTFHHQTMWEGTIREGRSFVFDKRKEPGVQRISEGGNLVEIADASYDFVLSSHVLEHLANPLAALEGWTRVLKSGGLLLTVLPHRDATFDHRRPVTTLAHLIQDQRDQVGENDLTHLDEILRLHDMEKDPAAGSFEQFKARSLRNHENRGLHHHVFDTRLAVSMIDHLGLEVVAVEVRQPMHIVVAARKPATQSRPSNAKYLGAGSPPVWTSAFPSDRR